MCKIHWLVILLIIVALSLWYVFAHDAKENTASAIKNSEEFSTQHKSGINQSPNLGTSKSISKQFADQTPEKAANKSELIAQINNSDSIESILTQLEPQKIINAYMSAWSGNNPDRLDELWNEISQCEDCLLIIQELMMNQALPKGMLLELTYRVIRLGNEIMLPTFDYLLQPSVDKNTRLVITQQMVRDGRAMYIAKILEVMQQVYIDGNVSFAVRNMWMISKLKNSDGVHAILDVITGKTSAPAEFISHSKKVAINTSLVKQKDEVFTQVLVDYYINASQRERTYLQDMMMKNNKGLVLLATNAYENGRVNEFNEYADILVNLNGIQAVEGIMELQFAVNYQTDYYIGLMHQAANKNLNSQTLQRLEDYLRNPEFDMQIKIVAAEGLLSVKEQSKQAKYILEKAISSVSYDDAEIVSYISARM